MLQVFRSLPPRIRFLLLFALIFGAHLIWEISNDLPPPWDMAYHEVKGREYWQAWEEGRFLEGFSRITTHFPPLYYIQEALVLKFLFPDQFLALLSNLPGLLLLTFCTFGIASTYMTGSAAVWVGLLPALFPFVAWTTRFSLLDGLLAGWVAAAAYCLVRSKGLQRKGWMLLFGLSCAAGVLTKWTFPVYVLFPLGYTFITAPDRRRALENLMDAALVSIPIAFLWYLPNLDYLSNRYPTTRQTSLIPWAPDPRHGEPGLGSVLGWIYYPRALSSYYLFLPLTLVFAWSATTLVKNRRNAQEGVAFLWWWLLGGLFLLLLVTPRDPRFVLPLAPPLALLLMYPLKDRSLWMPGVVVLAAVQFLTVSFTSPLHPLKISLFETQDSDYQSLQREWVLYETYYFEVAGPPRRENWRYGEILEALPNPSLVGFVPDLAHFHPGALKVYGMRRGQGVSVKSIGITAQSLREMGTVDYMVGKTGFQGLSFVTHFNQEVYRRLETEGWPVVASWDLPDQSQAILWRRPVEGN